VDSLSKNLSVALQVARIKRQLESVVVKAGEPVKDTLHIQASLVAAEIKSVAPVDPDSETPGALRDSVRVEEGQPTAKKAYVVKIKAGNTRTKKAGKGGKAFDYGRAVEFGTQDAPPHSFFFPIWRARRKGVRAVVRKAIKNAVKDVFK
jgi:HK97 gp10 family phage protein